MQWVKQYIHRSAAPEHAMSKDNASDLRYEPDCSAKSKLEMRDAQFTGTASYEHSPPQPHEPRLHSAP